MPTAYGLPNCLGWYVADRGVDTDTTAAANGDGVARWTDLSGAGNDLTQPVAADRPVFNTYAAAASATLAPFGSPMAVEPPSFVRSVSFDGSTSLVLPPTLILPAGGCTVVLCSRGAAGTVVSFGTEGGLAYGGFGTAPLRVGIRTPAAGVVPFPAATHLPTLQPIVHAFRCDGSAGQTRLYVGRAQRSDLPANYCDGPLTGGSVGRAADGSAGFVGEVFELAVFAGPLFDADVAALLANVQAANRLRADADATQLVFVGDGLTAGGPGAAGVSRCYPWHLCRQYGGTVKPLVTATPGHTVAQQRAVVDRQVLPLDRTPFAASVAVVCCGGEDLWLGGTSADTTTAIAALCGSLRSAGFAVAVATITPRAAANVAQQVTVSSAIAATNDALRAGHAAYADALVDWAADPRLADYADGTYFAADGWHTNDAGDGVKAQAVKAAVDPLLAPPTPTASTTGGGSPPAGPLTFASFYAAGRTFAGSFGRFPRS